jgi:hypothetical protein
MGECLAGHENLPTLKQQYLCPLADLFRCSTAVVQLTVNQLVVGSIPATGAKILRD